MPLMANVDAGQRRSPPKRSRYWACSQRRSTARIAAQCLTLRCRRKAIALLSPRSEGRSRSIIEHADLTKKHRSLGRSLHRRVSRASATKAFNSNANPGTHHPFSPFSLSHLRIRCTPLSTSRSASRLAIRACSSAILASFALMARRLMSRPLTMP